MEKDIQQTLKRYFGYDTFRHDQKAIIERSLSGQSSLVIMPTGGGKSLCYQLPAVLMEGLTLVVSPLISLMQDQIASLTANNIAAASLNSSGTYEDELRVKQAVQDEQIKLLYVSPERAVSASFISWLRTQRVAQIAIDESHCVSIWGNDFRPEYARLTELTRHFQGVPIIALTATADTATQADIRAQLKLEHCRTFVSSFERKNLTLSCLPGTDRFKLIHQFILQRPQAAGIIYCLSRRSTEELALKLRQSGINSYFYHAALKAEDRAKIQDDFQHDRIQIICATIAFGMGIDKPNIRWVIHYNLPKNIESYYQEIGRAGRDGKPAEALLFASYRDMKTLKDFIHHSQASLQFKQVQEAKLSRMWEFTQTVSCRTGFILNYFGEYTENKCGHCDRCLDPPAQFDATIVSQIALSACLRLNQSVNMTTLIDVIRGSSRQEIIQNGYHQIKTYGVGRHIDFKTWSAYLTQLIDQGYLAIDFTRGNHLKLTELARPVLKSEKTVLLSEPQVIDLERTKSNQGNEEFKAEDSPLFNALLELRKRLADTEQIQSYRVFSNATLAEIARIKPGTHAAFSAISGVGEFKLNKYGQDFVALICAMTEESERTLDAAANKVAGSRTTSRTAKSADKPDTFKNKSSSTIEATLALLDQGNTIEEIAQQRNLKAETIYAHIFNLHLLGKEVDISGLITADDIQTIQKKWLDMNKTTSARALYHALDEHYRYDQIKFALSLAEKQHN
jgi:ATP-dependent DNA helicase RecQ